MSDARRAPLGRMLSLIGHRQSTTAPRAGQPIPPTGGADATCYNPAPTMLLRDWVLLVTGTLLGVVSLTADLLGIGAFPGFGWKQILGTGASLLLVAPTAWRIFRSQGRDRSR